MAEDEGGQWNVATKESAVYLERVSKDNERLFDDSLDPHEARQLARLLTKFADKLDDSKDLKEPRDSDESDESDDSEESDSEESDSEESAESEESQDAQKGA
jgi:hypothetical protein